MIEGFDPDKFRKVNTKGEAHNEVRQAEGKAAMQVSRRRPVETLDHQMIPGAVPTYDMSEKQLLAAIFQLELK